MNRLTTNRSQFPPAVVFAAALAAALACCATAIAQENLVPNASFEQMDPETAIPVGWTPWAKENYGVFTFAAARSGVACVAITDNDPVASQGLRSPSVPVEPGKTYRADVWLKIDRLDKGTFALYLEYWSGPARVDNRSKGVSAAPDWTELTVAYPAPEGATHATVLVYGSSATVGRAYFDDASLAEVAAD